MPQFTEQQAKALLQKVIKLSKADECTATLTGSRVGNVRYALNGITTSGIIDDCKLVVEVAFGKRKGTATINEFDNASLARVVERAEQLAHLAPENPEFMPALPRQKYTATDTWDEASAHVAPEVRARIAADSITPCKAANLVAAGFFTDTVQFTATANSHGNFGYQAGTEIDFTCTVRTADGHGSGWVARNVRGIGEFHADQEIAIAIDKARRSADARALEPGKYTVILEPAATADLLTYMIGGFDAREADEGRSFLTRKGGGNRLGEKMFDERVTLYADPADPAAPVLPWDEEGLPREKTTIVDKGTVNYLQYSRYWAKFKDKHAVGEPGNLLMLGGDKSTMELVKSTQKGVLVTRTWYIRMVDPQTVLLTGLTRDGTFYIENGEIKYPIKNFRFNESPVILLNNIEELGKPVRVKPFESDMLMVLPPIKAREFDFTSLSDAV